MTETGGFRQQTGSHEGVGIVTGQEMRRTALSGQNSRHVCHQYGVGIFLLPLLFSCRASNRVGILKNSGFTGYFQDSVSLLIFQGKWFKVPISQF